jgi:hypothetical protein
MGVTQRPGGRPSTRLRRSVLAASLYDKGLLANLVIDDDGLSVPTVHSEPVRVRWDELVAVPGNADQLGREASLTRRVARWLRLRSAVDDLITTVGVAGLITAVRPVALPREHSLHPGDSWVLRTVLGGSLDVGLGLRGVDDDGRLAPSEVGLLPVALLQEAGVDPAAAQTRANRYLEDMAALAAERLIRSPATVLRPLGDCDVVTLLAAPAFRHAIVRGSTGVVGMRSAAVPVRRRGWLDLGRVDPAFALSAAALTEADERGFTRPLLITEEELVQVRGGGSPIRFALSDPGFPEPIGQITRIV